MISFELFLLFTFSLIVLPLSYPNSLVSLGGIGYTERIIFSVFLYGSFLALFFYLNPLKSLNPLTFFLGLIVLFSGFNSRKKWRVFSVTNLRHAIRRRLLFIPSIMIFFITIRFYFWSSPGGIRYHSSPDNHALAATVGYLENHFSYSYLSETYQQFTGLNNNDFYGQPTPKLDSVWSIPDAQLRFVSDNVFQVGRVAMPALGSIFGRIIGEPHSFPNFVLFFGFLGVWLCGILTWKLALDYVTYFSKNQSQIKSNLLLSNSFFNAAFSALFCAIYVTSPWAMVFILEGSINQIWFFVILLTAWRLFSNQMLNLESNSIKPFLFNLSLVSIFVIFSYPNGVLFYSPFLLVLLTTHKIRQFLSSTDSKSRFLKKSLRNPTTLITIFISFATMILSLLPIKGSVGLLTANFLKGAPNQPFTLGSIELHRLFFSRTFKVFPELNVGFGSGFAPLRSDPENSIFSLLVFGILITALYLFFLKHRGKLGIFILPLFATMLILVVLPSLALTTTITNFWPYQYLRNLTNVIVLSYPLLLFFTIFICGILLDRLRIRRSSYKNWFVSMFFLLTIAFNFSPTLQFGDGFRKNSKPFITISSDFNMGDIKNSFVVSNYPIHEAYQLSLFGSLFYLTDGWGGVFSEEHMKEERQLLHLYESEDGLALESIGGLKIQSTIKGPISLSQIIESRK